MAVRGRLPGVGEAVLAACLCLAVGAEAACSARAAPRSTGGLEAINWAQGLGLLVMCVTAFTWHGAAGLAVEAAGAVLMGAGAGLRCMAIRQLGSGFGSGARPATSTLCKSGIYGLLRHPAETGLLLIAAGFPLGLAAWLVLALGFPVLAALSWLRIRSEDKRLAEAFPEAFAAYRRRVLL